MPGKLIETLKISELVNAQRLSGTGTTLYNGTTATNTGLDTRDFDECVLKLSCGALSAGEYAIDIVESNENDASGATALADAEFDAVTTSEDEVQQVGSIQTRGTKRYLWVRTVGNATAGNFDFSATAVLGQKDENPESNSEKFDVGQ